MSSTRDRLPFLKETHIETESPAFPVTNELCQSEATAASEVFVDVGLSFTARKSRPEVSVH